MGNILNKLWASKGTTTIVLWAIVFAYAYNIDYIKKPIIHKPQPVGRTIEEIIATPVDKVQEDSWDTGFKSTIEATE